MNKIPSFKSKKDNTEYHHTSDETIDIYASSFLPRPKKINPQAHQAINKQVEVSKRGNDLLGTKPKKPNTMLMVGIMVVAIAIVAYVIYTNPPTDQQPTKAPIGSTGKTGGTAETTPKPPKPSDIIPIPVPGLS